MTYNGLTGTEKTCLQRIHYSLILIQKIRTHTSSSVGKSREIAVGLTPKGRTSVEYYGLNRKALLKERQEKYEFYKTLQAVLQTLEASQKQDTETYRKTSDLLEKMTSHEACYSGMLCYQGNELF